MSRFRFLFVESYPHVVYGQQKTLLSLLKAADANRIEAVVGVTAAGAFTEEVGKLGKDIVLFEYPSLLSSYGGAVYRYRGIGRVRFAVQVAGYVLRSRKMLKKLGVSGVFCNDMRGLLTIGIAARSLGLPVMIWDKLDLPHGWLDALQLPLATVNPVISQAVTVKYPAWQSKLFRDKITVLPNGADLAALDAAAAKRQELGIDERDVVFGIVGTITERKGHDRLLGIVPELVAAFPDALVLVIGAVSGSREDDIFLANLPNRDHPRVRFLGQRNDIPEIMHSIDALVIPSRHEGMGQVTVEAMACRKPVVGARAGGIQEVVVHGETGFLFGGDNSGELLDALLSLCNNPSLRQQMGEAGRARVKRFYNRNVQIGKVLDLLITMAGGRNENDCC